MLSGMWRQLADALSGTGMPCRQSKPGLRAANAGAPKPLSAARGGNGSGPGKRWPCHLRRLCFAVLVLVVCGWAVEPIYRVAPDVLFLPQDGLALNAHTGRVVWRFPRFQGRVYTDGHGLVLVSWLSAIQHEFNDRRITRICRLRGADGAKVWCRDWPDVQQWSVDESGQSWYLRTPERLQVLGMEHGQPDRGFDLPDDADLSLMSLPAGGALVLDRQHAHQEALTYHPGASGLTAESLPGAVYPFRGNGHGLLFYAKDMGEFFLASPWTLLFHRDHSPAAGAFPLASLDDHGFVFTDWQERNPVLRGGTYTGQLWQAARPARDPKLAVSSSAALMLVNGPVPNSTRLEAWDLTSGKLRYARDFDAAYPAFTCLDAALVLQSDSEVLLLDPDSGEQRWRVDAHEGPLAAVAQSAIVFWESGGELAALARNNGALLWRVRFRPL